uniref:Uncharacterized protein n=1 Tax=Oryza brachyantha TaxID=4533 RepID=J3MVN7_ORYBR
MASGGSHTDGQWWRATTGGDPLVVTLGCLEDLSMEQEVLAGAAAVEHAPLSALSAEREEATAAVLVTSLVFLPGLAQQRLRF